jgi:hypothetical protein
MQVHALLPKINRLMGSPFLRTAAGLFNIILRLLGHERTLLRTGLSLSLGGKMPHNSETKDCMFLTNVAFNTHRES